MNSINLIPPHLRTARALRAKARNWSLALAVSFLLALVPTLMTLSRTAHTNTLQLALAQIRSDGQALRTALRAATAQAQQTQTLLDRSRALRGKRSWSGLLSLLASRLPASCWLHSISTDPESPPAGPSRAAATALATPTSETPAPMPETVTIEAPRKLRLVGSSTNDSQPLEFVENLTQSGVFSRVALQKALRSPGAEGSENTSYQFEIVCEW